MWPGSDHWAFSSALSLMWRKIKYDYYVESHSCESKCCIGCRAEAERIQIPQKCRSEPEILLQVSALDPLSALGVIRWHFLASCRTQTAASLTPARPPQKNKSKHRQINLCRSSSRLTPSSPVHTSVNDSRRGCDAAGAQWLASEWVRCTALRCAAVVFVYFQLPSSVLVTIFVCSASPLKGWREKNKKGTARHRSLDTPNCKHPANHTPPLSPSGLLDGFTRFGGIFNEKMSCCWFWGQTRRESVPVNGTK